MTDFEKSFQEQAAEGQRKIRIAYRVGIVASITVMVLMALPFVQAHYQFGNWQTSDKVENTLTQEYGQALESTGVAEIRYRGGNCVMFAECESTITHQLVVGQTSGSFSDASERFDSEALKGVDQLIIQRDTGNQVTIEWVTAQQDGKAASSTPNEDALESARWLTERVLDDARAYLEDRSKYMESAQ